MEQALPQELLQWVYHGREERNLEYKEMLDLNDRAHQAKLAKAVLGMSNIRDGGVIVVGVKDDGAVAGLTRQQALSFTQDRVAAIANEYAAPYTEVTVSAGCRPEDDSVWFVAIEVKEFSEIPILCRRTYGSELHQGKLYVRGRRSHETTEIGTEAEMREVLDMAVEKGIRAFYRRIEVAGLEVAPRASDRQQFEAQLGGF